MNDALLATAGLSKRFGGVQAVNAISLEVRAGEIVSLVGPNGAGKTTVFNLVTGFIRPDAGRVTFRGRDITGMAPEKLCRLGLVRTFQASRVFGDMRVEDNVKVGAMVRGGTGTAIEQGAHDALDLFGARMHQYLDRQAAKVSFANRRRVELARAIATRPVLLAMDEPTAGMNPAETRELMDLIRRLRDGGLTVLVIEHDMTLVMEISDRVIVLDHGELLTEGPPEAVRANPRVIEAYLGRPIAAAGNS
jgi:branched-chain amino acid transport system ATP-binding protein